MPPCLLLQSFLECSFQLLLFFLPLWQVLLKNNAVYLACLGDPLLKNRSHERLEHPASQQPIHPAVAIAPAGSELGSGY